MSKYQVGDELAVEYGGYGRPSYKLVTVKRITPTGQVVVVDERGFEERFKNGVKVDKGFGKTPLLMDKTPRIELLIEREKLISRIQQVNTWEAFSVETLRGIVELLDQSEKEKLKDA